jgi:hypothetical protein
MMLSVDSKVVGGKRELKGLSPEIPIGKVNTVTWVENNTDIFVRREYIGFPGVGDHRMLHIVMIQSTWCQFSN